MTSDPRAALDRLTAALESHLNAVTVRRGDMDPVVESAYATLADAFELYDEALYSSYEETTPFVLYDDSDDDFDERDDRELDDRELDDHEREDERDDDDDESFGEDSLEERK